MRHPIASLLIGSTVLVTVGCGGERLDLVPVKGVVTYNGQPIDRAEVMFIRTDAQPAKPAPAAIATTAQNGSYELQTGERPGALPGSYKVTVQKTTAVDFDIPDPLPEGQTRVGYMMAHNMIPSPLLPPAYSSVDSTPLTFTITKGAENSFNIKLEGPAPSQPSRSPGRYMGAESGAPGSGSTAKAP